MTSRLVPIIAIAGPLLAALISSSAFSADIGGSADHPLIPRYEGSEIVAYETAAYTDHHLPVAQAKNYGGPEKNLEATMPLEGKRTRITYRGPADRSSLEVFRNYERALSDAGFTTIFACSREACGGRNFNHLLEDRDVEVALVIDERGAGRGFRGCKGQSARACRPTSPAA